MGLYIWLMLEAWVYTFLAKIFAELVLVTRGCLGGAEMLRSILRGGRKVSNRSAVEREREGVEDKHI